MRKSSEEELPSTRSTTVESSGANMTTTTTGFPEEVTTTAVTTATTNTDDGGGEGNRTNSQSTSNLSDNNSISPPATLDARRPSAILQLNKATNTWKITQQSKQRNNSQHSQHKRKSSMKRGGGSGSSGSGKNSLHSSFLKLQAYLRQENAAEFRFRTMVAFIFFAILVLVLLTRYMHYQREINMSIIRQIYLHKNNRKITFIDKDGGNLLHIHYGLNIPADIQPVNCRSISENTVHCLDWKYRAHLNVKSYKENYRNALKVEDPVTCYKFKWQSYEKYSTIKDCFDMTDSHWFGMGDLHNLQWPLNKMSISASPFVTNHRTADALAGSIIGRTWFLSKGVSITVPLDVPLFVSINSTEDPNKVCFLSKKQPPYHVNNLNKYFVHLEYTVCLAQNLSTLQNYIIEGHRGTIQGDKLLFPPVQQQTKQEKQNASSSSAAPLPPPENHEAENIFLDRIIWSTNPNVLPNFTQTAVQVYVDQITNYGLNYGIILLDSRWENTIGELRMNESVFNNPKVLVNILHNKGFKIMLQLSPNIALRSPLVDSASSYLLLDSNLRSPLLSRCLSDQGRICATINFTNPDNGETFKGAVSNKLLSQNIGLSVDGLYFQGIQSSLIPRYINFGRSINPDQFIEHANAAVGSLPTALGISTSVSSSHFFGYVSIASRDSSWRALQSIIPSVLTLGLLGYPLVNSDTVGGRHLFTRLKNETDYINKELYLRWFQLAIFLPVVQFAEPPGGNDLDVIKIAKRLLKLRGEHFLPAMKTALVEYYDKGSPIIRPMWWTQKEPEAYLIRDQFYVGNNIIVAPIVDEGKTERDIYLPGGWWKDEILAQVIRGGKWMRKYQVPLDKVAFFVRTEPSPPTV